MAETRKHGRAMKTKLLWLVLGLLAGAGSLFLIGVPIGSNKPASIPAREQVGRFTMTNVGAGILVLDTATGEVRALSDQFPRTFYSGEPGSMKLGEPLLAR